MNTIKLTLLLLLLSAGVNAQNWSKLNGPFKGQVNDFDVFSSNSNTILLTGDEGIHRTTNAGETWQIVSGISSTVITISTADPNFILTNNSRSFDGGLSWSNAENISLIDIKFAPGSTSIVYGIRIDGVVVRTTNFGTSWHVIDDSLGIYGTFKSLVVSLSEPNVVYTLSDSGYLSKSENTGSNWQRKKFNSNALTSVCGVVSFKNNQRIIIAADDSVYVSNDGAQNFTAYFNSSTSSPRIITIDELFTNTLYILSWYTNSPKSIHRSTNGGVNWHGLYGNAISGSKIKSTSDGKLFYSSFFAGIHLSLDRGENFSSIGFKNIEANGLKNSDNETFYTWDQIGYFKTTNAGQNWTLIHGTGGFYQNSLSISNQNNNKIFISNFTNLSVSEDGGINWVDKNVAAVGTLNEVYLKPDNHDIIYAKGFSSGTSSFILGRSTNGGTSWGLLTKPSTSYFWDIRFNIGNADELYFLPINSINTNLYRSTDLGNSWNDIAPFLEPQQFIHDLKSDLSGKIYCGANSFYSSSNFGSSWDLVYQYIYPNLQVFKLYIDRTNPNKIYSIDPNNVRFLGSSNGGITWFYAGSGLPEFFGIKTADITPDGKIILSTDKGIFHGHPVLTVNINNVSQVVPEEFKLEQNYPNPFNPMTRIKFSLPENIASVKLEIFDNTGRLIMTLFESNLSAGTYEYTWNASGLPSGVYFYRLITEKFTAVNRMLLIK